MTQTGATKERAKLPRVVILGSDAILAARPATPVQLAHACARSGYALAVPITWGDELVAAECVRTLAACAQGTMVLCSCPLVRQRLLARGPELVPFMISLVSPPVATARYVRAVANRELRVHFVGRCPSGGDESIDRWIDPNDFFKLLRDRGIEVTAQPTTFAGVLPPDRRRHWSLAGGFPAPDQLWEDGGRRRRVEPEPELDLAAAVVQQLLSPEPGLLDLAPGMDCACAGVVEGVPQRTARATLALTEPPRAPRSVVDHTVEVSLTFPIEAVVVATTEQVESPPPFRPSGPYARVSGSVRASDFVKPASSEGSGVAARRRPSPAGSIRPSPTSVPVSRQSDGRLVPRAYAARRRATPTGTPAQPELRSEHEAGDDPDTEEGVEGDSSRRSLVGTNHDRSDQHAPASAASSLNSATTL